jgi:hypothetical protein
VTKFAHGDFKMVKLLLELGAEIPKKIPESGSKKIKTFLREQRKIVRDANSMIESGKKNVEPFFKKLLVPHAKFHPNILLRAAIEENQSEIVRVLLELGGSQSRAARYLGFEQNLMLSKQDGSKDIYMALQDKMETKGKQTMVIFSIIVNPPWKSLTESDLDIKNSLDNILFGQLARIIATDEYHKNPLIRLEKLQEVLDLALKWQVKFEKNATVKGNTLYEWINDEEYFGKHPNNYPDVALRNMLSLHIK